VLWYRSADGCWIPDFAVQPQGEDELRAVLKYCPGPLVQEGGFREQYQGSSYCYSCRKLDCAAKPIRQNKLGVVELGCWTEGDKVDGDE
jgi:hypothetical protein